MGEREKLERSIADLEDQRASIGDSVVDAALAPLKEALDHLDGGPTPTGPSSQRRVMTVLFCDVTGSTALAEKMDPEEWTIVMNDVFKRLNASVAQYDGTIARLMGDAILAFFGAPIAHENDPERAVLAGLEILSSIESFREELKREKNIDFNVRVGINTGLAVVGEVGSEIAGEYTAMGDAVNVAARMEQAAAPGTVQISEATFGHIAPLFDVEALGGIQVKGKSQPVDAYRVLGRRAKPGKVRGLDDKGLSSPMVGREPEFAALGELILRLREEEKGGLALIVGEAGLGKSRLKDELNQKAGTGLHWLEGQTISFGQTLSYWPFRQILQDFAGITEEDDETVAWSKLEGSVGALYGEKVGDILPYLASLLALKVPGSYGDKIAYLDSEALGKQLYLVSRRFFDRVANEQPLVLVFEDLHWMDSASARLIAHLLPLIDRAPILIIGLSRPEPDSIAGQLSQTAQENYPDRLTEINLSPLPADAGQSLVENLLAVEDLPSRLREDILDRAGGNPFFLEEIVRTLIDTGMIKRDPSTGRWGAADAGRILHLPDTIQGLVMARVDLLEEEIKEVLRAASVVGRSFLYRVLQAVTNTDEDLGANLDSLASIDLIREKQRIPELEYVFKHALAQEAVYESILLQTRRQIHWLVAKSVESIFVDRQEEFYGLLAYHYARAEAWEKALDYLLKAGDSAGQIAADDEALANYRRAMAAYEQGFGESWDPVQHANLERKMGEAFHRRGDHEEALTHLYQALKLLGIQFPSSRRRLNLAVLGAAARQFSHRLIPGLVHEPDEDAVSPQSLEITQIYRSLIQIEGIVHPKQPLTRLLFIETLNISERIGYPEGMFMGYHLLSMGFALAGRFRISSVYMRLAQALADTLKRPDFYGYLERGQVVVYQRQGNLDKAVEHGQKAARYLKGAGMIRDLGVLNIVVLEAMLTMGRFEEIREAAEEMRDLGEDAGDKQVYAWGIGFIGLMQRYTGEPEQAIITLGKYAQILRETFDYSGLVIAQTNIGHCYLQMGQPEAALSILQDAQKLAEEHHITGARVETVMANGFAWVYVLLAEKDSGSARVLEKAFTACEAAEKSTRKFYKVYKVPRAEALRLLGTCYWLGERTSEAREWWDKSLTLAIEIGQPYEQAMTLLEIGNRLEELQYVEKARVILKKIGARPDLL